MGEVSDIVQIPCPDAEPHAPHDWRGFAGDSGCRCPGVRGFGYFIDERHCLYVGWVLGIALKHGFDLRPEVDDDGNYTDRVVVSLKPYATVTLVVPYPPDDWTIDGEAP